MKCVRIRELVIGEGMPKICVPIVGENMEQVKQAVGNICSNTCQPDMIELRADWFTDIRDRRKMLELLTYVRSNMEEIPLLFTFRTAQEGGKQEITRKQYEEMLLYAAKSGCIDAADVEAFSFDVPMERLIEQLHQEHVAVIASNHDFGKTPAEEEMLKRVERMWQLQADIVKLAVMPVGMEDVLELLHLTWKAGQASPGPLITMSMSGKGVISRFCGELFGSAVTFASAGKASAPGQIDAGQLRQLQQTIHESCNQG